MIFTLIYSDGFFMQSRNFRLQKVGDINWLKKNYQLQKISFFLDEIIILDASRNTKDINNFSKIVAQISENVFIPVSAGGGIESIDDAVSLFNNGADKIVLNTVLYENSYLVKKLINKYGSQSVVASVDYKKNVNAEEIYIRNGIKKIDYMLDSYLKYLEDMEVGEIYLNSIDQDGTGFGYDLETISRIHQVISCPLIIAGGAGNENHLLEGFKINNVSAVATANLFNFVGDGLSNARNKIISSGVNIANWKNTFESLVSSDGSGSTSNGANI